ncbi:MAG: hypothetical protein ACTHOG_07880 [Marmoricola sp.]
MSELAIRRLAKVAVGVVMIVAIWTEGLDGASATGRSHGAHQGQIHWAVVGSTH